MHFRKVIRKNDEEVSLDGSMIRVLLAIDERKDHARIARETGMDVSAVQDILSRLLKMKLIEPVDSQPSGYLDKRFTETMKKELTRAIGPMAEILIEDVISDSGFSLDRIPIREAAEVIRLLAMEIPEEAPRIQFQKSMVAKIPKEQI